MKTFAEFLTETSRTTKARRDSTTLKSDGKRQSLTVRKREYRKGLKEEMDEAVRAEAWSGMYDSDSEHPKIKNLLKKGFKRAGSSNGGWTHHYEHENGKKATVEYGSQPGSIRSVQIHEAVKGEGLLDHVLSKHDFRPSQHKGEAGIHYPAEHTDHVAALKGIHSHLTSYGYEHSYDDMHHLSSLKAGHHSHDFDRGNDRISVKMRGPKITHIEHVKGYHGSS